MALSVPLYTVDDLEQFPDDGNRYELLDGVLLVTPSPAYGHQAVVPRLASQLIRSLDEPGIAHVLSPGAVVVRPRTQLQPDILVVPAMPSFRVKWEDVSERWLAVEVFSPSSRMYDREFKRDAYFALGLQQVWLVDWEERFVEVCTAPGKSRRVDDVVRWSPRGVDVTVTVDLKEVFAGVE